MRFSQFTGLMFAGIMGATVANAAVIDTVKANAEDLKKFIHKPQLIKVDGKDVFATRTKGAWQRFTLKKKIKVDPAKKYVISVKLKQNGEKPLRAWIGFVPTTEKGHFIRPQHVCNSNVSITTLAEDFAKGSKTIKVKNASKWEKGKHYYIAFNAKKDMSDMPNFALSTMISKIEKTGDVYTITLTKPLQKAYPAGTQVRQHRSGGTYVYTKSGKAPQNWTVWKGRPAQKNNLRKGTYIQPMVMFNPPKGSGAIFDELVVEEL